MHLASVGSVGGVDADEFFVAAAAGVVVHAPLAFVVGAGGEVAEVDAALLTDDLPPAAFSDPGFVQFLKTTR